MLNNMQKIEEIIGHRYTKQELIMRAFTHSSYAHEHGGENYERLEFLGDSLLETITTLYLYSNFSNDEGTLSKMRAKVVSAKCLARVMKELKLDAHILVGGSINSKDIPDNVVADVYESIVASLLIDGGTKCARDFVMRTLLISKENVLDICASMVDYKTVLQEKLQSVGSHATYDSEDIIEDNKTMYRVSLLIDGVVVDTATDVSKKGGQEAVAKKYLERNGGIS
ncbi:MAG: hypothetical protein E7361_02380 [Clostridiales bacterium]|nr:hypothetical protein [Clostridiales bacterium]